MRYFISGANRGIGLEFVRQLAEKGETVYATCRKPEAATELQALAEKGDVTIVQMDVTDVESVTAARATVGAATEGIDVLINNAGIFLGRNESPHNFDPDLMRRTFETNVIGVMNVTSAFTDLLEKGNNSRLMNVSSQLGSLERLGHRRSGSYSYNASKSAVNMITRLLAHDLPTVTVVTVHPGWVQTDMGGSSAAITPEESVRGLLALLGRITLEDTNKFFGWNGSDWHW